MAAQQLEEKTSEVVVEAKNLKKMLVFLSDGLYFGVDISNVIEIITNSRITYVPKMPEFIKGIINLRGQIIPIVDVRERMKKSKVDYTEEACIIVLHIQNSLIGILVEGVSYVTDINMDRVTESKGNNQGEYVLGVVSHDDKIILLMDYEGLVQDITEG